MTDGCLTAVTGVAKNGPPRLPEKRIPRQRHNSNSPARMASKRQRTEESKSEPGPVAVGSADARITNPQSLGRFRDMSESILWLWRLLPASSWGKLRSCSMALYHSGCRIRHGTKALWSGSHVPETWNAATCPLTSLWWEPMRPQSQPAPVPGPIGVPAFRRLAADPIGVIAGGRLAACPGLRVLALSFKNLVSYSFSLAPLAVLVQLTELRVIGSLHCPRLQDAAVLTALTRLEVLALEPMYPEDLVPIPSVRRLKLATGGYRTMFSDAEVKCLAWSGLTALSATSVFTPSALKILFQAVPGLRTLHASSCEAPGVPWPQVPLTALKVRSWRNQRLQGLLHSGLQHLTFASCGDTGPYLGLLVKAKSEAKAESEAMAEESTRAASLMASCMSPLETLSLHFASKENPDLLKLGKWILEGAAASNLRSLDLGEWNLDKGQAHLLDPLVRLQRLRVGRLHPRARLRQLRELCLAACYRGNMQEQLDLLPNATPGLVALRLEELVPKLTGHAVGLLRQLHCLTVTVVARREVRADEVVSSFLNSVFAESCRCAASKGVHVPMLRLIRYKCPLLLGQPAWVRQASARARPIVLSTLSTTWSVQEADYTP